MRGESIRVQAARRNLQRAERRLLRGQGARAPLAAAVRTARCVLAAAVRTARCVLAEIHLAERHRARLDRAERVLLATERAVRAELARYSTAQAIEIALGVN